MASVQRDGGRSSGDERCTALSSAVVEPASIRITYSPVRLVICAMPAAFRVDVQTVTTHRLSSSQYTRSNLATTALQGRRHARTREIVSAVGPTSSATRLLLFVRHSSCRTLLHSGSISTWGLCGITSGLDGGYMSSLVCRWKLPQATSVRTLPLPASIIVLNLSVGATLYSTRGDTPGYVADASEDRILYVSLIH